MTNNAVSNDKNQFLDSFSEEIWQSTYKDHKDKSLSDTFRRVAKKISSAEMTKEKRDEWEEKFFDMLTDFKCVTGGRIMSNAGTDWSNTTFMNCFVGPLPSENLDSIDNIFKVLSDQANTLKSEGGWGMDFSWIRPRGAFIGGVGVESPGAVKFMELFDKSSEIVTSGSGKKSENTSAKGKIRKGAMMGVMSCTHPDILEFITAKQSQGRLSKFNMSVNCTDEFMNLVLSGEDADWNLEFPETTFEKYKLEWRGDLKSWKEKGYPVKIYDTVKVQWLWNLIMESTYNRAEPGILFLDRANVYNPLSYAETILSTNPCGEQTLAPGGVCCLGSLNLTQFVLGDLSGFDLEKLKKYVGYMVRFLDNVNTVSGAPLPEYKYSMIHKRRIGAGVMGWGSALFMLRVKFGSEQASILRDKIMQTYATAAYEASIDLAIEKGMFPLCEPEKHANALFIKNLGLSKEYMNKLSTTGIRNSSVLSQQPTGNTSIVANIVSGGIEPVFMPEYIRTVIVAVVPDHIKNITPKFHEGEFIETDLFKFSKEGDEDILRGTDSMGTVYKIDRNRGLTKEVLCEDYGVRFLKKLGKWDHDAEWAMTTTKLSVQDHVNDLKGFARWTDSACSKTANIPNDYPYADFKSLYEDVYKTGYVKGFTTYRSGTMASVLSAKEEIVSCDEEIIVDEVKLPDDLPATLKTLRAEGRKWYLTIIHNETKSRMVALFVHTNAHEKTVVANDAVECLINLARNKGIKNQYIADVEDKISGDNNSTKICRAISLCLRHGVSVKSLVSTLDKVDCLVGSFVFRIRKYLASLIKDGEKVQDETCIECGSHNIVYQEGCKVCVNCGSSKCG